jgi:hypothetical protein
VLQGVRLKLQQLEIFEFCSLGRSVPAKRHFERHSQLLIQQSGKRAYVGTFLIHASDVFALLVHLLAGIGD